MHGIFSIAFAGLECQKRKHMTTESSCDRLEDFIVLYEEMIPI